MMAAKKVAKKVVKKAAPVVVAAGTLRTNLVCKEDPSEKETPFVSVEGGA
jgi:hypothetical protein